MNTSTNFGALNIAPQVPRHPPLAWVILLASLGAFCISLFPLGSRIHELNALRERQIELHRISATLADELRREALNGNSLAARERERANHEFQALIQMSWEGVFTALESAALSVHGGTSIVSMIPTRVTPAALDFDLTALASNLPIMLAYLEALKSDPHVRSVKLITQQPDDKTSPDAVRFQITVSLDPTHIDPQLQRKSAIHPTSGAQNAMSAVPLATSSGVHKR